MSKWAKQVEACSGDRELLVMYQESSPAIAMTAINLRTETMVFPLRLSDRRTMRKSPRKNPAVPHLIAHKSLAISSGPRVLARSAPTKSPPSNPAIGKRMAADALFTSFVAG
jgi:hypothetical protein